MIPRMLEGAGPGKDIIQPWSQGWQVRLVAGVLLSFLGGITLGDVPYTLTGYGLSAFGLLTLAFLFPPTEAMLAFAIGNTAGLAVDATTQSLFLFVALGAALIRPIQLYVVSYAKRAIGYVGGGLVGVAVGTFAAITVGIITFGGNGSMTAFAAMDAIYILPAYVVLRWSTAPVSRATRWAGAISTAVITVGIYLSASTYLVPVSLLLSLLLLGGSYLVVMRPRISVYSVGPGKASGIVAVVTVLAVGSMLITPTAAAYAVRSELYPLYPDSLADHQWIQTSSSPACQPGNIAGGGTFTTGVWHPERLRVLSTCVTVTGRVTDISPSFGPGTDGDYSFDIQADAQYDSLLTLGNTLLEGGYLHCEIVPMDQHRVLGNGTLHPGQRVQVTGALVLDTDHGFGSEVHPAWSVQVLPNSTVASIHPPLTLLPLNLPEWDWALLLPGAAIASGTASRGRLRRSPI